MAVALAMCCVGVSSAVAGVIRTIPVGEPLGVSSDGSHVWVTNEASNTVGEIEASTGTIIRTIPVAKIPFAVSSDGTHVWVTCGASVVEIEASTGAVIRTIPVGGIGGGVSSDGSDVWVTNRSNNTVSEIEASTGTVIRTIPVGSYPGGVSSDGTDVWVANEDENTVSEIEAATGMVINTIPVGSFPMGVSSDGVHVWVANDGSGARSVTEIEASTGAVINTISVGAALDVSSDGTHVWVTNINEKTVSEIDASTGTVIHTISVGKFPEGVSSDGTDVWVANQGSRTISEIVASGTSECAGNTGTITLSPGVTDTATVQEMKVKGTLTGCGGETFTDAAYTASLKTAGPVTCGDLTGAGETATGPAKYKWTPDVPASSGPLSLRLTEAPEVVFSGELTSGSYSSLTLTDNVTERYTGAAECGVPQGKMGAIKPVRKGTLSG